MGGSSGLRPFREWEYKIRAPTGHNTNVQKQRHSHVTKKCFVFFLSSHSVDISTIVHIVHPSAKTDPTYP